MKRRNNNNNTVLFALCLFVWVYLVYMINLSSLFLLVLRLELHMGDRSDRTPCLGVLRLPLYGSLPLSKGKG